MTDKKNLITPIILAGGSGTRIWPLSRDEKPKQLLSLLDKLSLLQLTINRLKNKIFIEPIIITGESHRFIVQEQLNMIGLQNCRIILEPFPKNTAAAISVATMYVEKNNLPNTLLILPSDHFIDNNDNFIKSIKLAAQCANKDKLICLGISPTYPSSKFGYITANKSNLKNNSIKNISNFIEKPSKEKAAKLIAEKALWNSGIFCFKHQTIIEEIKNFEPNIIKLSKRALENSKEDMGFLRLDETSFKKIKSISIDKAVFEKTNKGMVIQTKFSWNDLGTYDELWKVSKKDKSNNVIKGDIITHNVKNSYIFSEKKLVSVSNLNNIVLIATNDVIMAADITKSEDIKNITNLLRKKKRKELVEHPITQRPWGYFENLFSEKNYKVKKLYIYPGKKLSLQQHKKRSEHWIIVSGKARVTKNDKVFTLLPNQSTYIPKLTKHRLENNSQTPLIIIEIQTGSYFGEDDIKRFEDVYGRK